MKVLNDVLGYKDLKIYQDDEFFCFSLDSVVLANYSTIRMRDKYICDLCTGNAVVPLILSKRTDKKILGIEIQKSIYDLAVESVEYNNLGDQIKIVNDDVKNIDYNETFDLVLCNPPYFKVNKNSFLNDSIEKQIARHELMLKLEELIPKVSKILKNNGNFAIVHRPERLMDIIFLMRKYFIEPKRIKFVFDDFSKNANLVFVEGQKFGKPGLTIEKPLILNENGQMTDEYKKLTEEVL